MSDRELLELAAKAIGGEYLPHAVGGYYIAFGENKNGFPWNPLADDGDALRLAMKLRMKIAIDAHPTGFVAVYANDSFSPDTLEPIVHGDTASATRRAIVRAAGALVERKEP